MSELAALLSRFLRVPVLDATGLPGAYEVSLIWKPDAVAATPLALRPQKSPADLIVVDHAEKTPTEN